MIFSEPNIAGNARIINIESFLELMEQFPAFDVRTPAEFEKGHIPESYSLPLFSDSERADIGTLYRKVSKDAAILKGLEYVGPKMYKMIEQLRSITKQSTVLLHCWRGGMRSSSVAWLLGLAGYQVYLLQGGYKAFRHYVLGCFNTPQEILVLSGYTGSEKSKILEIFRQKGEQVIELEKLAHHKGSSFGSLGELPPPSQEQFENQLAMQWRKLTSDAPIWIEDESRRIGSVMLPSVIWQQMRSAATFFLEIPVELRISQLIVGYGSFSIADLRVALLRLKKKLGGLYTKQAIQFLEEGKLEKCCEILLRNYYDKTYAFGLSQRESFLVHRIYSATIDPVENARKLLMFKEKYCSRENISYDFK